MYKQLRDGQEVFRPETEIQEEVDRYSDDELVRQVARYYTNLECNFPTVGIIKHKDRAIAMYAIRVGVSNG